MPSSILIVEDHEDTRRVLVRLLTICGYDAVGVADGQEALLYLQDHRPQLMILDWMMPVMAGPDVLRAVRTDPRLKDMAVIFYTAVSRDDHRELAMSLGAQDFLLKAGPISEFFAAVERYAGKGTLPQGT
jgi:two-component system phosphate regulon response regulator PhoB